MIDAQKVRAYHRTLSEMRRLADAGFDLTRHREVQRIMLLARERQRHDLKRVPVMPGMTKRIVAATSKVTGVSVDEMFSLRLSFGVKEARWTAAWLCRKHTRNSYPEIGRRLGGKDHSSIMYACRGVQADLDAGGRTYGPIIAHVERELGVA